jgi:hypothetical protein
MTMSPPSWRFVGCVTRLVRLQLAHRFLSLGSKHGMRAVRLRKRGRRVCRRQRCGRGKQRALRASVNWARTRTLVAGQGGPGPPDHSAHARARAAGAQESGTVREASCGAVHSEHKVAFRSLPSSPCPDAALFSPLPAPAPTPASVAQVGRLTVAAAQNAGITFRVTTRSVLGPIFAHPGRRLVLTRDQLHRSSRQHRRHHPRRAIAADDYRTDSLVPSPPSPHLCATHRVFACSCPARCLGSRRRCALELAVYSISNIIFITNSHMKDLERNVHGDAASRGQVRPVMERYRTGHKQRGDETQARRGRSRLLTSTDCFALSAAQTTLSADRVSHSTSWPCKCASPAFDRNWCMPFVY